jgi:hypothetical protein
VQAAEIKFQPVPPRAIKLIHGGLEWLIDPDLFYPARQGGPPSVEHTSKDNFHRVVLSNAAFPGLDLVADFVASFYRRHGEWFIRIRFLVGDIAAEFKLAEWMGRTPDGKPLVAYEGALVARQDRISAGNGTSWFAARRLRARIRIDASLRTEIDAPTVGLRFESPRVDFNAARATIDVSKTGGDPLPPDVKRPRSIVRFDEAKARKNEVSLGRIGDHQSVALALDGSPHTTLAGFVDRNQRDGMLIVGGAKADGFLIVHGRTSGPPLNAPRPSHSPACRRKRRRAAHDARRAQLAAGPHGCPRAADRRPTGPRDRLLRAARRRRTPRRQDAWPQHAGLHARGHYHQVRDAWHGLRTPAGQ